MDIGSLLNPSSVDHHHHHVESTVVTPPPPPSTKTSMLRDQEQQQPPKRQKLSKADAVFVKGRPKGEVRYPPFGSVDHDNYDPSLAARHREYQIFPPVDEIKDYPQHIPYSSEKKDFLEKTGREAFEVFHYTFVLPGDDVKWTVMWDYNVGLTRITHFFKCCKYSKTTPARAISLNPGLRDISHSITGGSLLAQGYWLPYDAARAVAANFCWHLRAALTPLFGPDFVRDCLHPADALYATFRIPRTVVQRCRAQAEDWQKGSRKKMKGVSGGVEGEGMREREGEERENRGVVRSGGGGDNGGDGGNNSPGERRRRGPALLLAAPQQQREQPHGRHYDNFDGSTTTTTTAATTFSGKWPSPSLTIESGYASDTERPGMYLCSPQVSPLTQVPAPPQWASVNNGGGGAAALAPAVDVNSFVKVGDKSLYCYGSGVTAPPAVNARVAGARYYRGPTSSPVGEASSWMSFVPRSFVPAPAAEVEGEQQTRAAAKRPISTVEKEGDGDDDDNDDETVSVWSAHVQRSSASPASESPEESSSRDVTAARLLLNLLKGDSGRNALTSHREKRLRRASH
ncbi:APSES transcription factor protein [Lasiodiplodia theobromae]|uniref:APSES transcription factor protein n=1 Tax=Lasiodiplodia theobromae TaxID=45133 RepID=UPI0015C407E2|nr:APSES transcription factor protein [Lasiodiplodia theobromae]KAF4546082.1 APSES transcription factor protein [Lasiodiplodia theobromae]